MKKRSPGLVLLLVTALVLLYASWQVAEVGENLQYVTDAPALVAPADDKTKPGEAIISLQESFARAAEDWSASMRAWTLGGVVQQASLSSGDKQTTGRLELLGGNAFGAHPRYLLHGRLFYEDELSRGDRVILLDEQTALALFAVADPIDRIVTFNQAEYRVVGVLRHAKQVGDYADHGAYIPLNSVLDQTLQMDALVAEAAPIPGAGANIAFSEAVRAWRAGGTVIDLGKESMAAGLWLRALLFAVGAAITLRCLRGLSDALWRFMQQYKRKLRVTYASRLLPMLAGGVVVFVLGYGVLAVVAAALMNYIIQPVYTFPEWIPTVLVEWDDIASAFWNVWQTPATVREFRTPELMRLRFFTLVIQGGTAVAGAVCALWFGISRAKKASVAESLRMLADSGVAASCLQAADSARWAEVGYVSCAGGMLRVINAQRALELMPGTARDGTFTLAVEDPWIPENNRTFRITCHEKGNTVCETRGAYDLKTPVQTLTELLYGSQRFEAYLESHVDFDLRMRSPAMEGFFSHHLRVEGQADA